MDFLRDTVWPLVKYGLLFGWIWDYNEFKWAERWVKALLIGVNILCLVLLLLGLLSLAGISQNPSQQSVFAVTPSYLKKYTPVAVQATFTPETTPAFFPSPTLTMATLTPIASPTPNLKPGAIYSDVEIYDWYFGKNDSVIVQVKIPEKGSFNLRTFCPDNKDRQTKLVAYLKRLLSERTEKPLKFYLVLAYESFEIEMIDLVSLQPDGKLLKHDFWGCTDPIQ